jgi:peptidoglycan/LPS O-acetylase OafA/YrhL
MPFRPDINGLRAVAVIAVVLFHFGVPGFKGGFIGVDVFFVISGYLMMQILHSRMLEGDDSYSAMDFYRARARRILPALLALVAVLLLLGGLFLIPGDYEELGRSTASALLFVSNIVFWRQSGYFDSASHHNWLLHTWSLSVEWQFYLFLPLLFLALRRYKNGRYIRPCLFVLAAISLALSIAASPFRPAAAFYLLPTRCWELFAGAFAFFYRGRLRAHPLLDFAVLSAIGACTWLYSSTLSFPSYWAAIPVLATAVLLASGSSNRLLAARPMQFLGEISYSLYLWHWPLAVAAAYLQIMLTPVNTAICISLAVALGYLSYRLVETPSRRGSHGGSRSSVPRRLAPMAVFMCAVVTALCAYFGEGLAGRLPSENRETILANQAQAADWRYPVACHQNFRKQFPLGSDVTPAFCPIGTPKDKKILFWGDSMIEQLYPALEHLSQPGQARQFVMGTSGGCIPVRRVNRIDPGFDCPGFNLAMFARASAADIDTVVLGGAWTFALGNASDPDYFNASPCADSGLCTSFPSPLAARDFVEKQLSSDIATLVGLGKKVVLILSFPQYQQPVPLALARSSMDGLPTGLGLTLDQHRQRTAAATEILKRLAATHRLPLIDPATALCAEVNCAFEKEGVSLYKDGGHLASSGAELLAPSLSRALGAPI